MKKLLGMNLLVVSLALPLALPLAIGGCGDPGATVDAEPDAAALLAESSAELFRAAKDYSFTKVAAFGEKIPSGGQFSTYFFPHAINDRGDIFFESYSTLNASVFRIPAGKPLEQFAGSGLPAPGGGFYGEVNAGFGTAMNQNGDAVFKYLLDATEKDSVPIGRHAGVFRVDAGKKPITLMRPGTTLAPNGKPFVGAHMYSGINRDRDVVFAGIIETSKGIKAPPEPDQGLGTGIFRADARGNITSIVSPGDAAPNRGVFDFAQNPAINDLGDIAFGGHIAGETCNAFGQKQADHLFCAESVYLYRQRTGKIVSIAHQGEHAPGGGNYFLAYGGVINNQGDVVFIGDFSIPPEVLTRSGVFLWSHGSTIAVARPGDPMPGGGHLLAASPSVQGYSINDRGEVFFFATLDTDKDKDGQNDTGVFAWKDGTLRLVLRSGTTIAGLGTVSQLSGGYGYGSGVSNNHGEVLAFVTTTAGNGYLVKATPR